MILSPCPPVRSGEMCACGQPATYAGWVIEDADRQRALLCDGCRKSLGAAVLDALDALTARLADRAA
jgi:hypothetical protein